MDPKENAENERKMDRKEEKEGRTSVCILGKQFIQICLTFPNAGGSERKHKVRYRRKEDGTEQRRRKGRACIYI